MYEGIIVSAPNDEWKLRERKFTVTYKSAEFVGMERTLHGLRPITLKLSPQQNFLEVVYDDDGFYLAMRRTPNDQTTFRQLFVKEHLEPRGNQDDIKGLWLIDDGRTEVGIIRNHLPVFRNYDYLAFLVDATTNQALLGRRQFVYKKTAAAKLLVGMALDSVFKANLTAWLEGPNFLLGLSIHAQPIFAPRPPTGVRIG